MFCISGGAIDSVVAFGSDGFRGVELLPWPGGRNRSSRPEFAGEERAWSCRLWWWCGGGERGHGTVQSDRLHGSLTSVDRGAAVWRARYQGSRGLAAGGYRISEFHQSCENHGFNGSKRLKTDANLGGWGSPIHLTLSVPEDGCWLGGAGSGAQATGSDCARQGQSAAMWIHCRLLRPSAGLFRP